jgi:hypothetical protein
MKGSLAAVVEVVVEVVVVEILHRPPSAPGNWLP